MSVNRNMIEYNNATKVSIIGAGSVGATIAYACLIRGVVKHLAIYDVDQQKVQAQALDVDAIIVVTPYYVMPT